MNTISLNEALETVMQLPIGQQEMLLDIVRSRQIERQRQEIAEDAQKSLAVFRSGELKAQSASELIIELRKSLDDIDV